MIVKGRARSGPEQLAAYLLRVGIADGERVTILDRHIYGDDLHNDFLVYDAVGDTGRTDKTLYHAQICPDAKYGRKLTPEEWLQLADMLAEDMGMAHHPRRVVLHDGGENPHAHVVFQRADPETLKMWEVWENFKKHEQSSLRMSKKFGMEIVPGKHAKRDRKKQPEFPRAESTQAEEQQAARLGMSTAERKEQITEIRQACDNAHAFKNALEDAGYVLAKGDQRGFVLVDGEGEVFSLSKFVTDIKGKEYKAFMAPIDTATLPSVDEAKATQERRQQEVPVKTEQQPLERSKFLTNQPAEKAPEPLPGPETSKFLPKKEDPPPPSKFLAPEAPAPLIGQEEYHAQRTIDERLSKFLRPPEPQPEPPAVPAAHTQQPPAGWTERTIAQEFQKADPESARHARERQRAAELRAQLESREQRGAEERAPEETKRRQPLPSDPWMAQLGGVDKLSPAHLASAQRSYEAWSLKDRYDFRDYVSYVQRQWETKELPPAPQHAARGWESDEIYQLRREIWQQQVAQMGKHAEANAEEYKQAQEAGKDKSASQLEDFDIQQQEKRQAAEPAPQSFWHAALEKIINTDEDLEKKAAEQREQKELLEARQAQERLDYIRKLEQQRAREMEELRARQLREQAEREKKYDAELERHIREKKRALELKAELEAEEREKGLNREKEEGLGEGKE